MFINYAHRGASAYAPENTMRAFRLGVKMGANGIKKAFGIIYRYPKA